jgi:hypothetical protein
MGALDGTNGPVIKIQFYKGSTWTDVPSADLRGINIHRGRARADQKMDAGTATVIFDNRSGVYDPDYLVSGGTWVVGGVSMLRDGLEARIVTTYASIVTVIFRGFLETTQVDHGFDATCTMTFIDGIAVLAKVQVPTLKKVAYNNELTKVRVGRLLTLAKWYPSNSAMKSLDGSIAMMATTQGADVISMIEECAAAQAGVFYVSRTGVATFLTLNDKFSRPTQLLFSDDRSTNTVEYDTLITTAGTRQVINQAIVLYGPTTASVTQQKVATYQASVTKYGLKTVTIETKTNSSTTASHLASYYAVRDSSPKTTVESIKFNALALGVLWDDLLETELLDQVTVKRTTVDGRTLTMNLVVEGMDHNITPDAWDVTFSTSPMNPTKVTI